MDIGGKVRNIRNFYRLSMKEFGELINYSEAHIGHVELGLTNPSITCLSRIAEYFNIPIGDLMDSSVPCEALKMTRNEYNIKDLQYLAKENGFSDKFTGFDYVDNHAKNLCDRLNLNYSLDEQNKIVLTKVVYEEIKRMYQNFGIYLIKGYKNKIFNHNEVLNILGTSRKVFDISGINKNESYRDNWLDLIKIIPVQFYTNKYFYFLESDVMKYKENLVSRKEIKSNLEEEYNLEVPESTFKNLLNTKYPHFRLRWKSNGVSVYYRDIIELLVKDFVDRRNNKRRKIRYFRKVKQTKERETRQIIDKHIMSNPNERHSVIDYKDLYDQYILPITNKKLTSINSVYEKSIENICTSLDLPYKKVNINLETEKSISILTFNIEVYKTIESFFINRANFLMNKQIYLTTREAINLLTDKKVIPRFDIFGKKDDAKSRSNWLKFIAAIPVKFYYMNTFYFLEKDLLTFKENYFSISKIRSILDEKYNVVFTNNKLDKVLNSYFPSAKIDWIEKEPWYPKNVLEFIVEKASIENSSYYPLDIAARLIGCSQYSLKSFVGESLQVRSINETTILISKETVDKWKHFNDDVITLRNLMDKVLKGEDSYTRSLLVEKMKKNSILLIRGRDTPLGTPSTYVFYKDILKIKELSSEVILERKIGKMNKIDKFKFISNEVSANKNSKTMKAFYSFAIKRLETLEETYLSHYIDLYRVFADSDKELDEFSDEEIEELINIYSEDRGKIANSLICQFINEYQREHNTIYKGTYLYDKHRTFQKKDNSSYTEEQYFRFGLLLLNETHDWYEGYLDNAIDQYRYATLWLYGVLHYLCAWRRKDMIEKLPLPTLDMKPKKFLEVVKNNQFTEEMAYKITTEVELKIKYLNLKPSKTKRFKPPNLVLEIPQSARYRFGMLLGICEAHRQLNNGKTLLMPTKFTREIHIEFFGEEFNNIFYGEGLNNIRLNKTFETLIAKKADEDEIGTGYILASFARSHICKGEEKSNTTLVYLEGYQKLTNSEIVMKELFERGVCSFVPYLVLKMVNGDTNVLSKPVETQTKMLNSLSKLHAYDIELVLNKSDEILKKAKKEALSIVRYYGYTTENQNSAVVNEKNKDAIYRFLTRLANGSSPARENNVNCISVAKGNGCIFKERSTCIGCSQEIYIKSTVFILGQRLRELAQKINESKNINSKYKYEQLINQIYQPALKEIMFALKNVYNLNFEEISELFELAFRLSKSIGVEESAFDKKEYGE